MKQYLRLIQNIIILLLIGAACFGVYTYFFSSDEDEFQLEDTPLHIEMIRTIAEISTVAYNDEVVVDTVEFFEKSVDASYYNPYEWYKMYSRNIKRRLTLIVKGEVRIGFNLTDHPLDIKHRNDTIFIHAPPSEVIDVLMSPQNTEVFQEQGTWSDYARRKLESKGRDRLQENALRFDLFKKANENFKNLLLELTPKDKTVIVEFNADKK